MHVYTEYNNIQSTNQHSSMVGAWLVYDTGQKPSAGFTVVHTNLQDEEQF